MAAHPRWAMLRTTAHAVRPVSGLSGCCGRVPAALGATGAEASCTWERGDPRRWTPIFVGIPTFFSDRQD